MNVYDFDGTVRRGDTSADFFFFALRRHPSVLLGVPRMGWTYLRYRLGRIPLDAFKSVFFSFLARLPDVAAETEAFRRKNEGCLDAWYLAQASPDDIIITASPEWLVAPLCRGLGVTVIGTPVDPVSGELTGPNCKGAEKVARLRERCGEDTLTRVERFYSDSLSDTPLAELAREAFLVHRDCSLTPWPQKDTAVGGQ